MTGCGAVHRRAVERLSRPRAAGNSTLRILIADDDVDFAQTTALLLTSFIDPTPRIEIVHDGESAIEAALREQPDVAIFDLMMPGTGGIDAARVVRSSAAGRAPLLIAVTGGETSLAMEAAFDYVLVKPLDGKLLISLVRAHGA